MEQALTLLLAAFQLLTVIATTPNLPASFTETAIHIANSAIQVAREEIAKQPVEVQQTIPTITPEVITQITQPTYQPPIIGQETTMTEQIEKKLIIETDNFLTNKNGLFYDVKAYYTEDGKEVAGQEITLTGEGSFIGAVTFPGDSKEYLGTFTAKTHSGSMGRGNRIGINVQFVPSKKDTVTLTATANGVETSIEAKGALE